MPPVRLAIVALACLAASCSSTVPTPASTTPPVTNLAVTSVTISGVRNPMAVGDVEVLKATARYADNSEADVTSKATWKSGDAAVFSMSKTGVLTAVGKGLTGVEVSYLGATAVATGVVNQPGCTYQVSPVFVSLERGANFGRSKVTTQPGCAWTVSPDVDWVTLGFPLEPRELVPESSLTQCHFAMGRLFSIPAKAMPWSDGTRRPLARMS